MRTLVPEFKVLFWAILGVIVPFGFLLYFFPSGTDSYWAWFIPHPRSAMLIGAGYLGAIAYYAALLRQNDWAQTQNGMGGLVIFCVVLLIATLLHWNIFKAYHLTTLVWLMFYYVGPFLVPIVHRLQRNYPSREAGFEEQVLPKGWRVWLAVRGFFYLALALFWVVSAPVVSLVWPWEIRALELRVFMGQVAIIGWNAIVVLHGGNGWRHLRLGMLLTAAIGTVQLVGLLAGPMAYDWSRGLGFFIPLMFVEWVATPVLMWLRFGREAVRTVQMA
jgi:hypothetical protein